MSTDAWTFSLWVNMYTKMAPGREEGRHMAKAALIVVDQVCVYASSCKGMCM